MIAMMYFFMIPVPAWAVGLILLYQSYSTSEQSGGGHLGGMIAGSACYFFFRTRPIGYWEGFILINFMT